MASVALEADASASWGVFLPGSEENPLLVSSACHGGGSTNGNCVEVHDEREVAPDESEKTEGAGDEREPELDDSELDAERSTAERLANGSAVVLAL